MHFSNLLRVRCRQRTAQHGEIKGIDKDDASVYLAVTRNDTITFDVLLLHAEVCATMHYMLVQLDEGATIEQGFYTFSCCKFHFSSFLMSNLMSACSTRTLSPTLTRMSFTVQSAFTL